MHSNQKVINHIIAAPLDFSQLCTFSQNFSSIDNCFVYFTGTFCRHDRFWSLRILSDQDLNSINDKFYFVDLDIDNAIKYHFLQICGLLYMFM